MGDQRAARWSFPVKSPLDSSSVETRRQWSLSLLVQYANFIFTQCGSPTISEVNMWYVPLSLMTRPPSKPNLLSFTSGVRIVSTGAVTCRVTTREGSSA